ncbi:MAG: alpha/beta hydrolase [Planctomycetota bacterium]
MTNPKYTRPLACVAAMLLGSMGLAQPTPDTRSAAAPTKPPEASASAVVTPFTHVEKRGTGPVQMILMPGLLCDWTVWDAFMTRNADKYTMYAVTLPGFGGSTPPPLAKDTPTSSPVWLDNAESAVLKLIDEKKLDKPVFVGHSMGGFIAARLGARHADRFRALVAIDGYPAFPLSLDIALSLEQRQSRVEETFKKSFDALSEKEWSEKMKGNISNWITNPERARQIGEMVAKVSKSTGSRYMLELLASDVTPEFAACTTPFLFVGAISDVTSKEDGDKVIANVVQREFAPCKAATAVVYTNTRHFVMEDAPAKLDEAIAAFVAGKPVPGALTLKAPPAPVKALPVDQAPKK